MAGPTIEDVYQFGLAAMEAKLRAMPAMSSENITALNWLLLTDQLKELINRSVCGPAEINRVSPINLRCRQIKAMKEPGLLEVLELAGVEAAIEHGELQMTRSQRAPATPTR